MAERKTAEIKFRCTPSFKASVQASAQAADLSMSEYIESAMWALQNAALDSAKVPQTDTFDEAGDTAVIALDEAMVAAGFDSALPQGCTCRPWEFCTHKAGA